MVTQGSTLRRFALLYIFKEHELDLYIIGHAIIVLLCMNIAHAFPYEVRWVISSLVHEQIIV